MRSIFRRSFTCLPRLGGIACGLYCGLVAGLALWSPPPAQAENVALELVLAIDVSSSVNNDEYRLQMSGFAEAFRHPAVITVIESLGGQSIVVTLAQWSGADTYVQAIDWTRIKDRASAQAFAAEIEKAPRLIEGGATAIGDAMLFARALLELNDFTGTRRTIDISGDGIANQGKHPAAARALLNADGITVNGLAILNEEPRLGAYYRAGVVGGPNAFLITATDFDDFARAIRIKLVTEIDGPLISALPAEIELAAIEGRNDDLSDEGAMEIPTPPTRSDNKDIPPHARRHF